MAEMTDELRAEWERRAAGPGDWFKDGYEAALGRIEDNTGDADNAYWWSPASETDATLGGDRLTDNFGSELTIAEAREMAFELLALADLAETTPARSEPTHGD